MLDLSTLTDDELRESFKRAAKTERGSIAIAIGHIAEMIRRKAYLDEACTSITAYCEERMGYGHWAAVRRVAAAYLAIEFPLVLEMLDSGELHLCALREIGPTLTKENHVERLKAAVGKTRHDLQRMAASWNPQEVGPSEITMIKAAAPELPLQRSVTVFISPPEVEMAPTPPPHPEYTPLPKPVTADTYAYRIYLEHEAHVAFMKLRDHLRHSVPDGEISKVFTKLIMDQLAAVESRKFGKLKRPKKPKKPDAQQTKLLRADDPTAAIEAGTSAENQRAPNRETRREVSERDGQQCTFVSADGHRCSATAWLEFDHRVERARGGKTNTQNMQMLCRAHNQDKQRKLNLPRGNSPKPPSRDGVAEPRGPYTPRDRYGSHRRYTSHDGYTSHDRNNSRGYKSHDRYALSTTSRRRRGALTAYLSTRTCHLRRAHPGGCSG